MVEVIIPDIFLSASSGLNSIGRPCVYIVVDVCTHLVEGLFIGMGEPNLNGVKIALFNTLENKVQFCEKHGVEIAKEDWPCCNLPGIILLDRGEFIGDFEEIKNLSMVIKNISGTYSHVKGVVEVYFRTLNTATRFSLHGPNTVVKENMSSNNNLVGSLTIQEFTELIIRSVLQHNQRQIKNYDLLPEMMADGNRPALTEVRKRTVNNPVGYNFDKDKVRLTLLPKTTAIVTESGIKFNNLYYSSEVLKNECFSQKTNEVEIRYDPRESGYIYILSADQTIVVKSMQMNNSGDLKAFRSEVLEQVDERQNNIKGCSSNQTYVHKARG